MSINDVAKQAGVSKSTVSLVINNSPIVAPETAAKVREAMAELGYEPAPREQRQGPKPGNASPRRVIRVTLITMGIPSAVMRSPIYSDVLHGISMGILKNDLGLSVHHVPNPKDLSETDVARFRADGFLLFGKGESAVAARALRESPCVSIMGISGDRPWTDWVSYDDTEAGRLAATHVLAKGHRNCAYIGLPQGVRGAVFTETIRAAGGTVECYDVESLMTRREDLHEVSVAGMDAIVRQIAALNPRPTAIFSWSDMLTAVLYPSLYAQGLVPERDITVVSCNHEYPLLLGLRPRPAVVDIQGMKVGQRAVEQLLWRIANRDESRVVTFLTPVLVPAMV